MTIGLPGSPSLRCFLEGCRKSFTCASISPYMFSSFGGAIAGVAP
ncbi:hypothetical protein SLEP1_g13307 [Rubroshorea leprosula]|uniref:Uncharacterized protein n=1 Tax=Rubroshorea leprosula TaxID=152421 RepID=A0AAV5IQS4_9ROSI|nr:hypothetical protein SLEP1_g13307 [Rubroshorea leprosula]